MIHKALKTIREFHGIKQVELASTLDISRSYLCEIEAGTKNVSLSLLDKYSDAFNIPVSSLMFFSENYEDRNLSSSKFKSMYSKKILKLIAWLSDKSAYEEARL